jgi:glycosyltransferase involved in cell wall biosynthesis
MAYKLADRHIGLSPGIVEGIARHGIDREKIATIPNGCDFTLFQDIQPASLDVGIKESDFVAIFSGTHGVANGLDAVLNAAGELIRFNRKDIKIILVGDGKLKSGLVQRANQEKLDNIIFLDPVSKAQLAGLFSKCHVGMQILANIPAFYYGTSPNKFFDYIAFGLPVLINYPGWLSDLVEKYECGVVVKPDDSEGFAKVLVCLSDSRNILRDMSNNANSLAKELFDRNELAQKFCEHLVSVS